MKDLLDAFYLLGKPPEVTLFAVSIAPPPDLATRLSPALSEVVPQVARMVLNEVAAG